MRRFQDLDIWVSAHQVTLDVYQVTGVFPSSELYGLTSQLRRAAASIPSNIAEGSVRSPSEYRNHLRISLGSATELDYHLLLAADLGFLLRPTQQSLATELDQIRRMLFSLQRAVGPQ